MHVGREYYAGLNCEQDAHFMGTLLPFKCFVALESYPNHYRHMTFVVRLTHVSIWGVFVLLYLLCMVEFFGASNSACNLGVSTTSIFRWEQTHLTNSISRKFTPFSKHVGLYYVTICVENLYSHLKSQFLAIEEIDLALRNGFSNQWVIGIHCEKLKWHLFYTW